MTNETKKRILDLIASFILIIITFPLQILIYLTTLIILKENPIFIQERGITLENFRFRMLKFRTMKSSDEKVYKINRLNFLKPSDNIKLNPISNFFRNTGLDELPQLYNVLIGKMSLVGPRPLMIDELLYLKKEFPEIYKKRSMINCKPALTGIWQIFGDRNYGAQNLVELDLYYENNKSLFLDFQILVYTVAVLIHVKKASSIISRMSLFEKIFSSSFYFDDKNNSSGRIVIVDSMKDVKKYKINLPVEWWYINNSLMPFENELSDLSVIHFRKEASTNT